MSSTREPSAYLLRRNALLELELERFVHQHNPEAVRHTASLTDPLGFTDMGVHLVRVEPGSSPPSTTTTRRTRSSSISSRAAVPRSSATRDSRARAAQT